LGHRKSDLGVRHIGFQNGRPRQPEIGYVFGSESTTNVTLVAKERFSGQRNWVYQNKQETHDSCCWNSRSYCVQRIN